jgi:hypothetical protein
MVIENEHRCSDCTEEELNDFERPEIIQCSLCKKHFCSVHDDECSKCSTCQSNVCENCSIRDHDGDVDSYGNLISVSYKYCKICLDL